MFARLDLDGGVVDVELVVQMVRDAAQEVVAGLAAGMTRWTVRAVSEELIAQTCRSWIVVTPGQGGEVSEPNRLWPCSHFGVAV
jgi:hypothetical protein